MNPQLKNVILFSLAAATVAAVPLHHARAAQLLGPAPPHFRMPPPRGATRMPRSGIRFVPRTRQLPEVHGSYGPNARLTGRSLQRAALRFADLRAANLSFARLTGADLTGAQLRGADLTGADLRGANLYGATLFGAHLTGADLTGANLKGALYDDATRWPRGFDPRPHGARKFTRPGSGRTGLAVQARWLQDPR